MVHKGSNRPETKTETTMATYPCPPSVSNAESNDIGWFASMAPGG